MVKIFADVDAAGKCLGFYPDDVWPEDKRPAAAIEIAEDLWRAWISDSSQCLVNGRLVAGPSQVLTAQDYGAAIDEYLDSVAQARDYKNADRLTNYVASTVPQYAEDAQRFIEWRDAVWVHAYQLLEQITASSAAPPTIEDLIASLPQPPWGLNA